MSSIPEEIQGEIILRLPVKSVGRFKSVCKSWCKLICDPKFVNDHLTLNNKNPRFIIKDGKWGDEDMFYSVAYASILTASAANKSDGVVLMDNPVIKGRRHMNILGSCNGLLCLEAICSYRVVLWNPTTNEYKEITLPEGVFVIPLYGFGYDSSIADYKLVCIPPNNKVYVYTLNSNSWREINSIPFGYTPRSNSAGLLLKGALHWFSKNSDAIISLDISSEKFTIRPTPEEIRYGFVTLGMLGDTLCLVCTGHYICAPVDVWVMQNYGARESWIKKFTTAYEEITSNPDLLKLYWTTDTGEILIQVREDFVLYDEKNDRLRSVNFSVDKFHYLRSESYIESLVSLNSGTYTARNTRQVKLRMLGTSCPVNF